MMKTKTTTRVLYVFNCIPIGIQKRARRKKGYTYLPTYLPIEQRRVERAHTSQSYSLKKKYKKGIHTPLLKTRGSRACVFFSSFFYFLQRSSQNSYVVCLSVVFTFFLLFFYYCNPYTREQVKVRVFFYCFVCFFISTVPLYHIYTWTHMWEYRKQTRYYT